MSDMGRMNNSNDDILENYIAPPPKRFPIKGAEVVANGPYLRTVEVDYLLQYAVRITEKFDGNRIAVPAGRYVLTVEDMLDKKSIFYRVPARYAVYDIFDRRRALFLDSYGIRSVMKDIATASLKIDGVSPDSFFPVPLVAEGVYQVDEIPALLRNSEYAKDEDTGEAVLAEGIIIKHDFEHFLWMYVSGMLLAKDTLGDPVHKPLTSKSSQNHIDPSISFVW
jgi:hypothetical protein